MGIETPGGSRGIAYISYQDKRDAQEAAKSMDGEKVGGNKVKVALADDKPPPSARPSREAQATSLPSDDKEDHRSRPGVIRDIRDVRDVRDVRDEKTAASRK